MPAQYKYEFISAGRLKALTTAASEMSTLYREATQSAGMSPQLLERLRIVRILVSRAANYPLDHDEVAWLEQMFGKDVGAEQDKGQGQKARYE